nr:hypothetical protein [Rubricella aquisinus]
MGSGPNVVAARDWARDGFSHIVVINNAWRVRPDWDVLVHAGDFPLDRLPPLLGSEQIIISDRDYVPAQNALGGFVYAGGTMAFTAAYWALHALKPSLIATVGCDMVYEPDQDTHFYGTGTADPLRKDITLRSLEAKSARLMVIAAMQGCAMVNLSEADESRLVYPRAGLAELDAVTPGRFDPAAPLAREAALGYMVPSGQYWLEADRFDVAALDALDAMWLRVAGV